MTASVVRLLGKPVQSGRPHLACYHAQDHVRGAGIFGKPPPENLDLLSFPSSDSHERSAAALLLDLSEWALQRRRGVFGRRRAL